MKNALKQFTPEELDRIASRITGLEAKTDAEVVCAVATESGRYDRGESLCGLFVALIALISGNKIAAMGGWEAQSTISVGLQAGLVVGGFVAGSLAASYWHGLRRLFVGTREMETEVHGKAYQVFSQQGIGTTRNGGGLLIYLSLFEHRFEVRCDRIVAEKLNTEELEIIRDAVLEKVRAGMMAEGIIAGLDRAEEFLAQSFPASDSAAEELPNQVLLFHPRP